MGIALELVGMVDLPGVELFLSMMFGGVLWRIRAVLSTVNQFFERLDHVIVLGEDHLRRTLLSYVAYCNRTRTHLSLSKDAPHRRAIQLPVQCIVRKIEHLGGLQHEYVRLAA